MARADTSVSAYRRLSQVLALVTVALGVALLVVTIARGGGIGILLGLAFVAAGAGRLYLQRSR
jgi:hypothetical protein